MDILSILGLVGICLLVLAAISGVALFIKATFVVDEKDAGKSTLWGLFVFGLIMGLILIYSSHGCHR